MSRTLVIHVGGSKEDVEASYLAGLMHDVGILVFDYLIPDEYGTFVRILSDSDKNLEDLELDTLAFLILNWEPGLLKNGGRFRNKLWHRSGSTTAHYQTI